MFQYIAFHKPYGVLSQFTPEGGHEGLKTFGFPPEVYAAGRLDHDSEGLLLLTDDGRLIRKLLDPTFGHSRTYLAQVEGVPTPEALETLRRGISLKEFRTKPCQAEAVDAPVFPPRVPPVRFRKTVPDSWIRLTLTEGKNRQVRRMTAAVGFPTLRLIRTAIGKLELAGLMPGEWRFVRRKDVI